MENCVSRLNFRLGWCACTAHGIQSLGEFNWICAPVKSYTHSFTHASGSIMHLHRTHTAFIFYHMLSFYLPPLIRYNLFERRLRLDARSSKSIAMQQKWCVWLPLKWVSSCNEIKRTIPAPKIHFPRSVLQLNVSQQATGVQRYDGESLCLIDFLRLENRLEKL